MTAGNLITNPTATTVLQGPTTSDIINHQMIYACAQQVVQGTSTVAIDNKIEQAMDLVKSHLMFAVREEVDVLKEKIAELMERISQLEFENKILKAHATPETLALLTSQKPPPVALAAASLVQQIMVQQAEGQQTAATQQSQPSQSAQPQGVTVVVLPSGAQTAAPQTHAGQIYQTQQLPPIPAVTHPNTSKISPPTEQQSFIPTTAPPSNE